jgi:hypothetical protein
VTRDKASKQKIESLHHVLGAISYLIFKLIRIFNDCIIVKSYKMDRMTIAERASAVEILVSRLSLRQQLLTLSQYLSRLQYFIYRQFVTWMIFLVFLENNICHYHRQQPHMECSRYSPKVKVTCHYQGLRSLHF